MFGRTTAEHLSNSTYCVIVGASEYRSGDLKALPAAAREVDELWSALTEPAGLAIPGANVTKLPGRSAVVEDVRTALKGLRSVATSSSTLFFYFGGHGVSVGDSGFGLCLHDSDPSDPSSLVSSDFLQELFEDCPARGIFVVLDCCGGAALANRAPAVFVAVRQAEFRILLSASREGQSSWETEEGSAFTRNLLRALRGEVTLGDEPGFLYFNELYQFLHDAVLEDHEQKGLPKQEAVFAGSYLRDPVLFVHGKLSRAQLIVKTKRYSQEYVRRKLVRWGGGLAMATSLMAGGYWTFLDQLEHAELTEDGIVLRRGHPDFQGFGLPKDVWVYDISRYEIARNSDLGSGRVVYSTLGKAISPEIPRQLTELGKIRWTWLSGDTAPARAALRMLIDANIENWVDRVRAAQLLGHIGDATDVERLLRVFSTVPSTHQRDVARGIVRLGQIDGLVALLEGRAGAVGKSTAFTALSNLSSKCDDRLQAALDSAASLYDGLNDFSSLYYVSLVSGCKLPSIAASRASYANQEAVAAYILTFHPERVQDLVELLTKRLEAAAEGEFPQSELGSQLKLLTLLPAGRCPSIKHLAWLDKKWRLDLHVGVTLARACSDHTLRLTKNQDYELSLARSRPGDTIEILRFTPEGPGSALLTDLLRAVETFPIQGDQELLLDLLASSEDSHDVEQAIHVLFSRRVSPPPALKRFFETTYVSLIKVALAYWATEHRDESFDQLKQRMADPTADFITDTAAFLLPNPIERRALLDAAASDRVSAERRAALVAMFGNPTEAAAVLCSASPRDRQSAASAIGFRGDLDEVLLAVEARFCPLTRLEDELRVLGRDRAVLEKVLSNGPPGIRNLRASVALFYHPTQNDGLRSWLRRGCIECL